MGAVLGGIFGGAFSLLFLRSSRVPMTPDEDERFYARHGSVVDGFSLVGAVIGAVVGGRWFWDLYNRWAAWP